MQCLDCKRVQEATTTRLGYPRLNKIHGSRTDSTSDGRARAYYPLNGYRTRPLPQTPTLSWWIPGVSRPRRLRLLGPVSSKFVMTTLRLNVSTQISFGDEQKRECKLILGERSQESRGVRSPEVPGGWRVRKKCSEEVGCDCPPEVVRESGTRIPCGAASPPRRHRPTTRKLQVILGRASRKPVGEQSTCNIELHRQVASPLAYSWTVSALNSSTQDLTRRSHDTPHTQVYNGLLPPQWLPHPASASNPHLVLVGTRGITPSSAPPPRTCLR